MPTVHISSDAYELVERKLVELTSKHQVPIKTQAVLMAAIAKGVDNVTIQDVVDERYLARAINVG